jgi:excisionase family DNA binding protein
MTDGEDSLASFLRKLPGIITGDPADNLRWARMDPYRQIRLRELGRTRPMLKGVTYYSVGQAARVFGVCSKTIIRWLQSGKMQHCYSPGGHRRIPEAEIRRISRLRRG